MSAKATAVAVVAPAAVVEDPVAVLEVEAPEVVVPEAVALEAVQVLEVVVPVAAPAPEVAVQVLEAAVAAEPGVALQAVAQVAEVPVRAEPVVALQAVAQVAQAPVRAELVRVARPVQGRPAWAAAQVESLRPAWAVRVPVSLEAAVEAAPLAALARRVQSARTLPALPAPALPQAVAQPVRRRRMARPRVRQGQDRRALGTGRGAASWRVLPAIRRMSAPSSCVPCTSGAISSRAPRTA
jgi:hypothetical protein